MSDYPKPQIADIVLVGRLPEWEGYVPAIITVVHSDIMVNLRAFPDQNPSDPLVAEWFTFVPRQDTVERDYDRPVWCWMPQV